MQCIRNLVEYYDELHPVTDSIKDFYGQFKMQYPFPQKFLHIGSGTGSLEFFLAKEGYDVTGIEVFQPLLDSAILKRRTQLLSIRFFNLSTLEMGKFLGRKFYNVISCLNNRIVFIRDKEMMRKFFSDCHELLSDGGTLVLQLYNYKKPERADTAAMPEKSSIRAKLYTKIAYQNNGAQLSQTLETGNGSIIPIIQDEAIYPLAQDEIKQFAEESGFREIRFFEGFGGQPATEQSEEIVCILTC
ncbi:MAG: class I SAM-dependent methyltransferase [Treponemataceae bacterium]|nr:class I SAM-dependent methyltransferase [Treponemataceae bacterium]